ncbi:MAG: flagellar hook protein FlgE [Gammaproteobacteria bacterium]|nr:flagellar hook protein FlgE [Gammaproteobacteria bacterium]
MPFRIALSGLNAASQDLKVTGNNIANSSTAGFKSSRTEFADVFATSFAGISKTAVGGGVRLQSVTQEFTQGTIDFTGNSLDMAINGLGFFLLSENGANVVSRAGSFQIDKNGFIVNSQGQRLQTYPALDPAGVNFNLGTPSDLQLTIGSNAPQATSSVDTIINLQADATDLGAGPIDPLDPNSYSYSSSVTVYDSLGTSHISSLYFRKTGANQWDVGHYVDGNLVTTGGANTSTVTFNSDGSLNTGGTIVYDAYNPANGANPINITTDLANSTQFGGSFNITSLAQDGFTTGQLSNIQVDEFGVISARFTNGQFQALGKVALGDFTNPNGLVQLGDNSWAESFQSGTMQLAEAGSGNIGLIQTGGLETSNVDISEQLVNLIMAQRSFQANAQVITTADAITQTMINIR